MVDSSATEVDPDGNMQILYKPEETPVTLAAKRSYLGRVYLDWAQYPITETEPLESGEQGYLVRFKDLRFQQPGKPSQSVLTGTVELDRNLKMAAEYMGSRRGRTSSAGKAQVGAPVD
jgi:inner membrane protein